MARIVSQNPDLRSQAEVLAVVGDTLAEVWEVASVEVEEVMEAVVEP